MAGELTLTPTLAQIGYERSNVWNGQTLPFEVNPGDILAMLFTFGVTRESERNLSLDPPIPFTRKADAIRGTSAQPWTLRVGTDLGNVEVQSYPGAVKVVSSPTPGLITTANRPTETSSWDIVQFAATTTYWQIGSSGFLDIVIEFDFEEDGSDSDTDETVQEPLRNKIFNSELWGGGFYVFFTVGGSLPHDVTSASFSGLATQFNTGWDGFPAEKGRPLVDQKLGTPAFAPEMMEDGYYHGVWTTEKGYDPDDPRNIRPTPVSETEGDLEDEVPQ